MRTAALLLLFVVSCLAQVGDAALPPLTVRAMICEPVGRDVCGKRTAKATYAPARIRVEVAFAQHPDNRWIDYGVICLGEDEPRSVSGTEMNGRTDGPLLANEFRDLGDGECYGFAAITRKDGAQVVAKAGPLQILPRD
jgi:hypothetical protein